MTEKTQPTCIQCGKDSNQVALIAFSYQGAEYQICTKHLPVLIHNPHSLTGKLPEADKIPPAEAH